MKCWQVRNNTENRNSIHYRIKVSSFDQWSINNNPTPPQQFYLHRDSYLRRIWLKTAVANIKGTVKYCITNSPYKMCTPVVLYLRRNIGERKGLRREDTPCRQHGTALNYVYRGNASFVGVEKGVGGVLTTRWKCPFRAGREQSGDRFLSPFSPLGCAKRSRPHPGQPYDFT